MLVPNESLNFFLESMVDFPNFKNIELEIKSQWGSINENYRLEIRKNIQIRWPKLVSPEILDLNVIPILSKGFCSVSHCSSLGGYVFHPQLYIGLDIENKSRISEKIVRRISKNSELKMIDSHFLWCIKESSFKSLISHKPRLVSDINLTEVKSIKINKGSNNKKNYNNNNNNNNNNNDDNDNEAFYFKCSFKNYEDLVFSAEGFVKQINQDEVLAIAIKS